MWYDTSLSEIGDTSSFTITTSGDGIETNVTHDVDFQHRFAGSAVIDEMAQSSEDEGERMLESLKKTIISEILKFIFEKATNLTMSEKRLVLGKQSVFNKKTIREFSKSTQLAVLFANDPSPQTENFHLLFEEQADPNLTNNPDVSKLPFYTNLRFGDTFNDLLTPGITQDEFANPVILPPKVNDQLLMIAEILSPSLMFKDGFNQFKFTEGAGETIDTLHMARTVLAKGMFDYILAVEVPELSPTSISSSSPAFDSGGALKDDILEFVEGPANVEVLKPEITIDYKARS